MKAIMFSAFAGFALIPQAVLAQTADFSSLRTTIDSLYTVESQLYQRWSSAEADSAKVAAERRLGVAVERHQNRIQALTDQNGFPTYAMVGKPTSQRFGTLILRYNRRPGLQQQVQKLMAREVSTKNADDVTYASLTDILELRAGRPQVYGTQLTYKGKKIGLAVREPLLEPAKVDARRASVGLESLKSYLKKRRGKHKPKSV